MTKLSLLLVIALCTGITACASSPEADQRPSLLITAERSLEFGVNSYNDNNYGKAEAHFDRALFLYRNSDNPTGILSSCINLSKTKLATGQLDSAAAYLKQAEAVAEREQIKTFDNHITVIESSIAIENNRLDAAKDLLNTLLETRPINASIKTAALQNRTRIAFIENSDQENWVAQYKEALNASEQNTTLNRARLLRFETALEPTTANEKLSTALNLYRSTAQSPGIAATLTEWAAIDTNQQSAANKLQRALFIRLNLRDKKNTQKILQHLTTSYKQLGEINKSERANYWQEKLNDEAFQEWDAIRFEFESYPG